MQVAIVLHFQGECRLSHHEHIAAQGLIPLFTHLTIDLGDQLARAGIEEKAAFIAGRQVRELGLDRLIHHIQNSRIHGRINHQFSFHILIDSKCRDRYRQHHHHDQCECQNFSHDSVVSFFIFSVHRMDFTYRYSKPLPLRFQVFPFRFPGSCWSSLRMTVPCFFPHHTKQHRQSVFQIVCAVLYVFLYGSALLGDVKKRELYTLHGQVSFFGQAAVAVSEQKSSQFPGRRGIRCLRQAGLDRHFHPSLRSIR